METLDLNCEYLTWTPKTVIIGDKEYPAPLNVLPILVADVMIDYLKNNK